MISNKKYIYIFFTCHRNTNQKARAYSSRNLFSFTPYVSVYNMLVPLWNYFVTLNCITQFWFDLFPYVFICTYLRNQMLCRRFSALATGLLCHPVKWQTHCIDTRMSYLSFLIYLSHNITNGQVNLAII